jgi:hypothetical protein
MLNPFDALGRSFDKSTDTATKLAGGLVQSILSVFWFCVVILATTYVWSFGHEFTQQGRGGLVWLGWTVVIGITAYWVVLITAVVLEVRKQPARPKDLAGLLEELLEPKAVGKRVFLLANGIFICAVVVWQVVMPSYQFKSPLLSKTQEVTKPFVRFPSSLPETVKSWQKPRGADGSNPCTTRGMEIQCVSSPRYEPTPQNITNLAEQGYTIFIRLEPDKKASRFQTEWYNPPRCSPRQTRIRVEEPIQGSSELVISDGSSTHHSQLRRYKLINGKWHKFILGEWVQGNNPKFYKNSTFSLYSGNWGTATLMVGCK